MADFQKMYLVLFNAVTDAMATLQKAQQQTEELYISSGEPVITILENLKSDNTGECKT